MWKIAIATLALTASLADAGLFGRLLFGRRQASCQGASCQPTNIAIEPAYERCNCICEPPCQCSPQCFCGKLVDAQPTVEQNFGIDIAQLRAVNKDEYCLNGKCVSREEAFQAVGGPSLPDDSGFLRVTAIGSKAETDPVRKDFDSGPDLAFAKQFCHFKTYTADAPMIKDCGFAEGKPAIYVQQPDGKVLFRMESYDQKTLVGALQKRKPNYDPKKDPTPSKPFNFDWSKVPGWAWALAGVAVVLVLKKDK